MNKHELIVDIGNLGYEIYHSARMTDEKPNIYHLDAKSLMTIENFKIIVADRLALIENKLEELK